MLLDETTIRARPPLALSDESLSTLLRLAQPLAPADRSQFLLDVADELRSYAVLGDGLIARVASTVQRRHLRPPDLSRGASHPRSRRKSPAEG
jgi:hypothetical protein